MHLQLIEKNYDIKLKNIDILKYQIKDFRRDYMYILQDMSLKNMGICYGYLLHKIQLHSFYTVQMQRDRYFK